jgi:micrococcal nuclease
MAGAVGCTAGASSIRVIDGDTLDVSGERIRLLGIDAPEMPAHAKCEREKRLAFQATAYMRKLVARPGPVVIQRNGVDRYGRTLARVSVGGVDLGDEMLRTGHAGVWEGHHVRWCD